jgi:tRNA U34 5-methylaminomethyl-2-thiouridine-forming methyltransferase MnmC
MSKPPSPADPHSRPEEYQIVRVASGAATVRDVACGETFHPVIGPASEARALYVEQMHLAERLAVTQEEFVIWDIGLGAAANPLTILRDTAHVPAKIRIHSFDSTLSPLQFALGHVGELTYFDGFEKALYSLVATGRVAFANQRQNVDWRIHLGDFPSLLKEWAAQPQRPVDLPVPHAILFDAFSPARNPAMWTLPVFAHLFQMLDPRRPCAMPTYSRATMLRVTLLLAGFYVGLGHATGEKEETTIAANVPELIEQPLGGAWLARVRRSTSAEPLLGPPYRQARLTPANWAKLQAHPQFSGIPEAQRNPM